MNNKKKQKKEEELVPALVVNEDKLRAAFEASQKEQFGRFPEFSLARWDKDALKKVVMRDRLRDPTPEELKLVGKYCVAYAEQMWMQWKLCATYMLNGTSESPKQKIVL